MAPSGAGFFLMGGLTKVSGTPLTVNVIFLSKRFMKIFISIIYQTHLFQVLKSLNYTSKYFWHPNFDVDLFARYLKIIVIAITVTYYSVTYYYYSLSFCKDPYRQYFD